MTDLSRIYARVFETPLMVSPGYLATMTSVLLSRENIPFELSVSPEDYAMRDVSALASGRYRATDPAHLRPVHAGGIAMIGIDGALHQRSGAFNGPSSYAQGYDSIRADIETALNDEKVNGVMLDIDSPGGEVAGNFGLVDFIARNRDVKPIWALANEHASSAAYNIAASASRVIAPDTANVGSIGVVTSHRSMQGALADAGIKVTFIHAGAHKIDGNAAMDLPDDVRDRVQGKINQLYDKFTSTVAQNRGIDADAVRSTEGDAFLARDALALNLVDDVMSAEDALGAFAEFLNDQTSPSTGDDPMSDTPARTAAESASQPEAPASGPDLDVVRAEAAAAETTRIMAILDSPEAQGREALARHFATSGMAADAAIAALAIAPKAAAPAEPDKPEPETDALAGIVAATGSGNDDVIATLSDDDSDTFNAEQVVAQYFAVTQRTAFPEAGGIPNV